MPRAPGREETNATRFPSGEKSGRDAAPSAASSRRAVPPPAGTLHTSPPETNAISEWSGEIDGSANEGTPAFPSWAGARNGESTKASASALAARGRNGIRPRFAARGPSPPDSSGGTLGERAERAEPAADDPDGRPAQPALEHGRVDRAEIRREGEIAHVQLVEVGVRSVNAAFDSAADQEDRGRFAVVGPAARVLRHAAAELAERHRQHARVVAVRGEIGVERLHRVREVGEEPVLRRFLRSVRVERAVLHVDDARPELRAD